MLKPLLITLTLLLAASALRAADPAPPVSDIEAQYQTAVHIMNKPPLNGVLVTEVGPDSSAAAAGLRAGDIITEFYGTKITSIQTLRDRVADAVSRRLDKSEAGPNVLMHIVRGNEEKNLLVIRSPLDIRAITIQANVPAPRNPPPNLRGTLALDWPAVAAALAKDDQVAFRTFERTEFENTDPNEEWIGWQVCKVTSTPETISGKVQWHRITNLTTDAKGNATVKTEETSVSFRVSLGDYKTTPAFILEEVTANYPGDFDSTITATGKRIGERLEVGIVATEPGVPAPATTPHENAAPLNTIPQPAIPYVAAAMPHEKDAFLGLYLLSLRDLQSRPGYVIVTRGRDAVPASPDVVPPAAKPAPAWRVDLVHMGVTIESYWFSDDRQLLSIQSQGVQSNISRRSANLAAASLPLAPKTQPASSPASSPAASAPGATRP